MNDEQLYEFLSEWECGDIDYSVTFCDLCKQGGNELNLDCDGCRKHWLQRDAVDVGGLMYWKRNTSFTADTPQTEERPAGCSKDWSTSCTSCERYFSCDYLSGRQTGTGSPIGDYRDGAGAWAPMPLGDPGSISDGTLLTALETWLNRNPDKQIRVDKRITRHGPVFTASIELAPWEIQKEE